VSREKEGGMGSFKRNYPWASSHPPPPRLILNVPSSRARSLSLVQSNQGGGETSMTRRRGDGNQGSACLRVKEAGREFEASCPPRPEKRVSPGKKKGKNPRIDYLKDVETGGEGEQRRGRSVTSREIIEVSVRRKPVFGRG